ncbi:MAG: D-glycero-beta-D-manno-heptose 1-phosphate adenylyltransferase [Proteobacteria bacterium]|nr:D-glycero-beta-D-manno-heptose 1-phosphate adenylyltransferase [Pseudomonadota bacterium]
MTKVLNRDALAAALDAQRHERRIVFTNGCYDLLHIGHVRLLQRARAMGDVLVVAINSDDSVRRLKGPTRPVVSESDRAEVLAALECVSYVTVFDEDTPIETLQVLRPHVHVKGGDYVPEQLPEHAVLQALNAEIQIFPLVDGRSSSQLIARARRSEEPSERNAPGGVRS